MVAGLAKVLATPLWSPALATLTFNGQPHTGLAFDPARPLDSERTFQGQCELYTAVFLLRLGASALCKQFLSRVVHHSTIGTRG